jgi:hypothetical protein
VFFSVTLVDRFIEHKTAELQLDCFGLVGLLIVNSVEHALLDVLVCTSL